MGLQKKAGNIAGPFLGTMSGVTAADWLAHVIHNNPGFFTRALYGIPGAYLGLLAGNKLQNKLQGTNRGAFWDKQDSANLDKVLKDYQDKKNKEHKSNQAAKEIVLNQILDPVINKLRKPEAVFITKENK